MPNYTGFEVKDERGDDVRLWRCDECGSTVGPSSQAKTNHGRWHDRVDHIESALRRR